MSEKLEARLLAWIDDGADQTCQEAAAELKAQRERIEALEKDNMALLKECSEQARGRGEAEGKLRVSEMAGIVDGWHDRALKAEAARDKALADVERFRNLLAGLVGLIQLCQHRFPADLQDEIKVHWRFTEAEAALKKTKP